MSHSPHPTEATPARIFAGGFLMGLANLVPGVSGGTMILALGLYDKFIGAVAELTSFRWSIRLFAFLGVLGLGLVIAVGGLASVAVMLVSEYRWIMYSLFIGMTLGGVPELWRLCRPATVALPIGVASGLAGMVLFFFWLSDTEVPHNAGTLFGVGALAASSMILPGVSGSLILLIFGLYEVVIGSLSPRAILDDPGGTLGVVVPVVLGAGAGIALLSNVLKVCLARYRSGSHGLLLGLLAGSILPLWPFQEAVEPELLDRDLRKAIAMLVVDGATVEEVEAARGVRFSAADVERVRARYGSLSAADLKRLSQETRRFDPDALRVGVSLVLVALGFLLTRLLGVHDGEEGAEAAAAAAT